MRGRGAAILIGVSVALAVLSGFAAVFSIAHEGLGANAAAWVQAGGSIAAIAGAVWLFRSETQRRREERRQLAKENAWAVRFAILQAHTEAETIAAEIVRDDLLKFGDRSPDWLLRTANCRTVLRVLAERTDHIHPALNFLASNTILLLSQLDEEIKKASSSMKRRRRPSQQLTQRIIGFPQFFVQLVDELDARMRGVLRELDEESPTRFSAWSDKKN